MKRSEMIEHLEEELLDYIECLNLRKSDKGYSKHRAAGILDMLEGFGMLPPKTILESYSINSSGGMQPESTHEWESE